MMTHDENSRFFSNEDVKRAFQFPDWPAGTEIVCYCRSTDNRDTIGQIAQRGGWKIVKYVHIDELSIAKLSKPGQVLFAKREAVERKFKPTPIELATWRGQNEGIYFYNQGIDYGFTFHGTRKNTVLQSNILPP